jgi:parvulin-like peptidyl-prolyl isomerase
MKSWKNCVLGLMLGLMAVEGRAAALAKVVVTGVGIRITEAELDKAYLTYVLTQKALVNVDVLPALEPLHRKLLLDDLIMDGLVALRADATDISQAKVKAAENYKAQRAGWATDFAFELTVEATGLTLVEFRRQLQKEALRLIVVRRELRPITAATEGDILKYYNDHPKQWKVPEIAKVAQVFFSKTDLATGRKLNPDERAAKHQTAAKVKAKAQAGIDFKKLVEEFSEDLISKPNGGEFQLVKGLCDKDLEREVFKLRPNQAQLIETDFGYHVVWMKERKPAKVKKLAEVSNDIRKYLQRGKFEKELPAYYERLKKQARVQIHLK